MVSENVAGDVSEGEKHSQHKILLPAWLTATHSDGCALNILYLQGHVCVKFLCKKKKYIANVISHASVHMKLPDSVNKGTDG